MSSFFFALQFLTVIPIKRAIAHDERKISYSPAYFPIVGLLLGVILSGINILLSYLHFNGIAASVILVIALAAFTGSIHLDGLSDTFDALLSGKSKDDMLRIMRDPHIGVMGVISIINVLLLKISFLFSIAPELRNISLILMCVLSRWSLVYGIYFFPYVRPEGKAKIFKDMINTKILFFATAICIFCAFFLLNLKGLLIFVTVACSSCLLCEFINKKIDGLTGDTLGALVEINEVLILLLCFLVPF